MSKILNLTQHPASPEQVAQGVFEPKNKTKVQRALTFNSLPTKEEIVSRAKELADIAKEHNVSKVMIGGAPYLMSALETAMHEANITPLYAFAERDVVEATQPDGSVIKKSVFKHVGFVEA